MRAAADLLKRLMHGESELHTETGRSRERVRRVLLSGMAAVVAKAVGLLATLATIPITAPYLGTERFGLFMTLSAIPLLMSFSDFGIGNGLLTELAKATGKEERQDAAVLVSSAFFMLLAVGALAIGISAAACAWAPWAQILGVRSPAAAAETGPALFAFAAGAALAMPIGIVQRVQQGFQEGYIANLWLALGNLLSFGLLLGFVRLHMGLPWLVAAVAGGPVIAGLANSFVEFRRRRSWLAPKLRMIRRNAARGIMVTGLMIFSSQAGAAVLISCPMFLLAHAAGPAAVAPFSILQRIYSVFVVASSLLMTPLWPAYSEAYARGDCAWVRSTFRRSLWVNALIAGAPLLALCTFAPWLTATISRGAVHATRELALVTALMSFLVATRHTASMMVNGCGYLRRTMVVFPLAALAALSYPLWPRLLPATYGVPLWISAAEAAVLCALLTDSSKILRSLARPAEPAAQEVCA